MKNLFFLFFLFASTTTIAQVDIRISQTPDAIIGIPDTIDLPSTTTNWLGKEIPSKYKKLIIAQFDLPAPIPWSDAKKVGKFVKGWSLPTKSELLLIYKNKNNLKVSPFDAAFYWSDEEGIHEAWSLFFAEDGRVPTKTEAGFMSVISSCKVRIVNRL